MISLGVDIGGTNTDIALGGLEQGLIIHKLPSTTDDPARGTVQGTREICEIAGIDPSDIGLVLHGTTVATNALLEHDGGRTGMLTTEGFRDIIHIGRHQRPHNFSLMQDIPFQRWPLVERKHRKTVSERVIPPGEITTPLDEERCVEAILELKAAGVESICVCFLFAFLDPSHELRAGELIAEHHPDAEVSLSHEVVAQFREFERFTTTAANAYLKPKTRRYLDRLAEGWREAGVGCPILVMQSNGGVAEIGQASHHAVNLLLSGPAAGVIAGRHVGTVNGHENLITLDIGGTSADISVIPGRLLEMDARDSRIGGYPILTPKLDVTAIGAGGGSIAWRDRGGAFNVGPRSAGAMPGPACYGRGGTDPTVTDAHVVLGRIDPDRFLDGRLPLDAAAAREAVQRIGDEFGLGLEDAALAILAIVNANMVREVRIHSVRRGYDPRECALVAFGGAGPLHACEVAEQLEVPVILLPPAPGITSAMGLLATDLKYDSIRTVGVMLAEADRDALDRAFAEMERDLRARFAAGDEPRAAPRGGLPLRRPGLRARRSTATPSGRTGASCSARASTNGTAASTASTSPATRSRSSTCASPRPGRSPPGRTPPSRPATATRGPRRPARAPSSSAATTGTPSTSCRRSTARCCAPGTRCPARRSSTRWTRPSSSRPVGTAWSPPTARSDWKWRDD